jgi:hypothetical protein
VALLIAAITGVTGAGVTVNVHEVSPVPAVLVARMVTVCGLPASVGEGHETTPVPGAMVMPPGGATSDQLIGGVP